MQSTPSGIAQLRKTSEVTLNNQAEQMDIDDFIFSERAGTPTGISESPETPHVMLPMQPGGSAASAISFQPLRSGQAGFMPQSAPHAPHHGHTRHMGELNYLRRHQRKTSMDERGVSINLSLAVFCKSVPTTDTGRKRVQRFTSNLWLEPAERLGC